jgi:hypothetical protein
MELVGADAGDPSSGCVSPKKVALTSPLHYLNMSVLGKYWELLGPSFNAPRWQAAPVGPKIFLLQLPPFEVFYRCQVPIEPKIYPQGKCPVTLDPL